MAARNSIKNQTNPMILPNPPIWAKTTGSVVKPSPKLLPWAACVPDRPRKMKAAVSVISPPKLTSKTSLVAEAVRPLSTTSLFFFM